jgi:hypothetical protein
MAKHHFLALGGYDEEMLPMAYQDWDLLRRAEAYGLDFIGFAQKGPRAIRNHIAEKMRHTGTNVPFLMMHKVNSARSEERVRTGRLVANCERKRRPVLINFSTELDL